MKICEQILKKAAPQYNSNSLNCEKTKRSAILAPAIAVWADNMCEQILKKRQRPNTIQIL